MIEINELRLSPAQTRIAQPDRSSSSLWFALASAISCVNQQVIAALLKSLEQVGISPSRVGFVEADSHE
jgi:hypothetical protein